MVLKINELIDSTKAKFGLDNYYLKSHSISRRLDDLNETVYSLGMEWFPNDVTKHEEDDPNPDGTAVIDIDINSSKYESVIFVEGISYANGIRFEEVNRDTVIKWIEQETGLSYGEQFKLHKEEDRNFYFQACFNDIYFSPSGYIKVNIDQSGNLTTYSKHGPFPSKETIKEEVYTLSLETIEHLAWEQLKLINFPSFESEKLVPVYGVEEIYITNDQKSLIPFNIIGSRERNLLEINKILYWDEPNPEPFERIEINFNKDITIEQALSNEPSPDSFPINETEQKKCLESVTDFLRQEYSNESGKWILKTLKRDDGYIHAILRLTQEDPSNAYQRKLMVIIDEKSLKAINFMDNKELLDHFGQFSSSEEVIITKKEAYEKLKNHFKLTPRYIYDFQQEKYILCGLLDCHHGIRASNGDIISLNEL